MKGQVLRAAQPATGKLAFRSFVESPTWDLLLPFIPLDEGPARAFQLSQINQLQAGQVIVGSEPAEVIGAVEARSDRQIANRAVPHAGQLRLRDGRKCWRGHQHREN